MGAHGPPWVLSVFFWKPLGLPLGAFWSSFAVRRILHFIWGYMLFSAARVVSWLSSPPSGCLGPVPLALRGRPEGPVSLTHGIACSVFGVNHAFFPRPSFFKPPKGGQRGVLEQFWSIFTAHHLLKMGLAPWHLLGACNEPLEPAHMIARNNNIVSKHH